MKKKLGQWIMPALWIAASFACAGNGKWLRGWICVAAYLIGLGTMSAIVRRKNAALFEARRQWRRADTKPFDRIFLAIYLPLTFIQPSIAGLDAVRFRWTSLPFWTLYLGLLLFIIAVIVIGWAMAINPHAETTVRIQADRGHVVIDSGPYRYLRHPMYFGALLMYPATGLMLGSGWALAMSVPITSALLWRTVMEDRTLQNELPGYREFTGNTRYRLIPGVW